MGWFHDRVTVLPGDTTCDEILRLPVSVGTMHEVYPGEQYFGNVHEVMDVNEQSAARYVTEFPEQP